MLLEHQKFSKKMEEILKYMEHIQLTPHELFTVALNWHPSRENLAATALLYHALRRIFLPQ